MWHAISQQLSETLMFTFQIRERNRIEGGDISECYMISDGDQRYFVKVGDKESLPVFEAEAEGLQELRLSNTVSLPELVLVGQGKGKAFIILNYMATKPLEDSKHSFDFGVKLAHLHQWGEQKEYGFDRDNYIGATIQPNSWTKKWCHFFSEQRIGWQLQLLDEKGIRFGDISHIVKSIDKMLAHHNPKPSLIHGDLWHGNVANTAFGPVCYDPACYWGDRECDIAMTELFDGFDPEFYQGYESVSPLDFGYQQRKDIYNFYHILNHCNLFGGHYLEEAEQHLEKLIS
ncbi:fructosamine kinase family protein [Vibrio sp. JC009]|uniref:fructosamine kinase family protein n=1 Tax=Vibrio sp. JC009 TaxID=2912314 RepID=UPI0023B16738|nr:fructosamine kinase family protein [Vibrio sp. JC009]WED23135.1 fructosamine kinase family protein [Vibrio sp. JC009]